MSAPTVRTRYAPSPTGFLHVGGLRTALYNYLFARHRRATDFASGGYRPSAAGGGRGRELPECF